MKLFAVLSVVVLGLGIWLYIAMQQSYGDYGTVRRVQCLSQLKSLARAALLYSEDNNLRLMPSSQWMDRLVEPSSKNSVYISERNIPGCPCLLRKDGYGYAYNSDLSGAKVDSLETPERMPFFYESKDWGRSVADPFTSFSGPFDPEVRESARANAVYVSGRAERIIKE